MKLWDDRKIAETQKVEAIFGSEFPGTDAYRLNSASIRVRVVDDRFEGKSSVEREAMVMPLFKKLPKKTRDDILVLLTIAPSELLETASGQALMNFEFERPVPSRL